MPSPPSSEQDSDEQLLKRTAEGDAAAFAALFRRCHAHVHRFALHMCGAAAVADDVTQDVFMLVMRDAERYQAGRAGVIAWLCGIARNCARQRLDRERHFQPFDDLPEPVSIDPAAQPDPLGDLTRAEGIARVRRAVLSLPIRYREVVVLCDLQEMSYTEAADVLGCAIGTVRSRLHRGRLLLSGKLAAPASDRSTPPRAATTRGVATLPGTTKLRGRTSCA